MADLAPEQVAQIIQNRPQGVSPEEIIQHLMDSGHNLIPPADPRLSHENGIQEVTPLEHLGEAFGAAGQGYRNISQLAANAGATAGPVGKAAAYGVGVPAEMTAEYLDPQTRTGKALQLGMAGMGVLGAGAGMAGKAIQESPEATKALASVGKIATGIPTTIWKKIIGDPDQLFRALPPEEASQIWENALKPLGYEGGETARLNKIRELNYNDSAMDKFAQETASKAQKANANPEPANIGEGGLPNNGPDLQDAITARQHLQRNMTPPPGTQASQRDFAVEKDKLNQLDQYISKALNPTIEKASKEFPASAGEEANAARTPYGTYEQNVPGYGQVNTYEKLKQIYGESMTNKKLGSLFPTTQTGEPSVTRGMFDALAMERNPLEGSLLSALQSPLLARGLVKGAVNTTRASKLGLPFLPQAASENK